MLSFVDQFAKDSYDFRVKVFGLLSEPFDVRKDEELVSRKRIYTVGDTVFSDKDKLGSFNDFFSCINERRDGSNITETEDATISYYKENFDDIWFHSIDLQFSNTGRGTKGIAITEAKATDKLVLNSKAFDGVSPEVIKNLQWHNDQLPKMLFDFHLHSPYILLLSNSQLWHGHNSRTEYIDDKTPYLVIGDAKNQQQSGVKLKTSPLMASPEALDAIISAIPPWEYINAATIVREAGYPDKGQVFQKLHDSVAGKFNNS